MRIQTVFLCVAILCLGPAAGFSEVANPPAQKLTDWSYRWGDPSRVPDGSGSGWISVRTPYNIPGRSTNSVLWLRTRLPSALPENSTLYIPGSDLALNVYLERDPIYSAGQEGGLMNGFVWREIPLPAGSSGKNLLFRFHSPLETIGFTGEKILAGSRSEIILDIIRSSADKFVMGFVFIALGIASVIFFLSRINQRAFLSFGLFNVFLGTYTIAQTPMKQLVFGHHPVFWGYAALLSLYALPAFATSFAKEILRIYRKKWLYWTWVVSIGFAAASWTVSFVYPDILMLVLPAFKYCLMAAIAIVFLSSVRSWMRGNPDARLFTTGFAVMSVFAVGDVLQELRLIPRTVYLSHWGLFAFVLTIGGILVGKIVSMVGQLKTYSEELEEKNIIVNQTINQLEKLYEEIEFTQKEVILRLSEITEARSKETGNHVRRVAEYSRILALAAGLPQQEVDIIKLAAPMHDIGKLAIPDSILMKPDKLTAEEFETVKTHTVTGYEMLKKSKREIFGAAAVIAHEHHERFDGTGYPRRLKGEQIHIYGRITAVADVFDSLASDRCYKKAWDMKKVLDFMNENRNSHFDPKLIDALFDNLELFMTIMDKYRDEFEGA